MDKRIVYNQLGQKVKVSVDSEIILNDKLIITNN